MKTTNKIASTIALWIVCVTTMHAQLSDGKLNKIWELNSVEHLTGMGGLGDEMKLIDMRSETQLIFEVADSMKISYKVVDQEIKLFDEEGNHLGQEIIWRIENLTADELSLVLIAREDNENLARLKYRAKR